MNNELVYNYEQPIRFIIGIAGTGKSTKLAELANSKSIVLTPTHKAKGVLEAKGVENVYTIHSVLKLVPTLDMNFRKKGKLKRLRRIGDVDLNSIKHVIIDEYSMISTYILDTLLKILPASTPVTIFGDSMQLSPVDGDPIDPEFYQTKGIVELTTQHRSEAPEVVETFTRFVEYLRSGDYRIDLRLNPKIKRGNLDLFNPDTDRALAFTNAEAISVNNRIASVLNLPKEISIGETISINGLIGRLVSMPNDVLIDTIYPSCIAKGKLLSDAKLEDKIDKIESDMAKFNQSPIDGERHFIEIEDVVYAFYGDINHYAHDKEYKTRVETTQLELINVYNLGEDVDLKEYCRNNKCSLTRARGKAWSIYLAHQNLVFDLRRPFCTTVHASQGSEFSTIYLAQDDIKKAIRGSDYTQYARLMYVALSRAINKVVII